MTLLRLAWRGVTFYTRTYAAVVLGVATAVAVLAGSLLVGSSVRASLAALAGSRSGRTAAAIASEAPFTERLAASVGPAAAPLLSFRGIVADPRTGRRASNVSVYGVDARFFEFHGASVQAPSGSDVFLSPDLAAEIDASGDDDILVRVTKPTDIPLDSLHGRREDIGRSIRLRFAVVLGRDQMGEFSLTPAQGPVRAAFVPLARLQEDLDLPGRANLLLADDAAAARLAADNDAALRAAITSDDLGIRIRPRTGSPATIVDASSGVLSDDVVRAVSGAARAASIDATPVLSWLANRMTTRGRSVPYSLVAAIGPDGAGDSTLARMLVAAPGSAPPIVLNDWTARDLGAQPGDALELEYYRWLDEGRLATERASFVVAGVVPMRGLAVDRELAPDYPGITNSDSVGDWDPPFPIDLGLVRPADEAYWKQYRTAPKAFIALDTGQKLWRTKYGAVTSLRLGQADVGATRRIVDAALGGLSPAQLGLTVIDVRRQHASAATGATDFGAYFTYFSVFLMVAALLLAALFFRLGIEQRLTQIGVLRATGFPLAAIRRLLTLEGVLVACAGSVAGAGLAIAWAGIMMVGLRTWWIGAVGTTELHLHVDWLSLATGIAAGLAAAVLSIALTVGGLAKFSARDLLTGARDARSPSRTRTAAIALVAGAAALLLSVLSLAGVVPAAGGFFGAASLALVAGLAAFRAAVTGPRRPSGPTPTIGARASSWAVGRGPWARSRLVPLAFRNLSWRPGRSLTAAGLVAAATFLLVSVDAFRKGASDDAGPRSGTGGFALIGETALPIVHDLSTPAGRDAAGLDASDPSIRDLSIFSFRLRPGDDASCLNLYQPKQPRVLGVPGRMIDARRFRFARSLASTDADRENPWRLLGPADANGVVPAIADATSLQYVLHAAVGDEITIDADTARPVRLRIVASLDDSVLQGELLIAESAFTTLFPDLAGYRVFLAELPSPTADRVAAATRSLEQGLEPFGFDAEETLRRLDAYHRVENTYLSTFQALGGLGLLLGSVGLVAVVARNVLERRRELALLGAAGYSGRDLQRLIAIEHVALVVAGLAIGLVAALIAVAPVAVDRSHGLPLQPLAWLLAVALVGIAASMLATRGVRKLPLVASLRSE